MTEYVPFQILTAAELNASIDGLGAAVAAETARAGAAETTLTTGLSTETARALAAELLFAPRVSSIAALRTATTTAIPNSTVYVIGYRTGADGGEGVFWYNASDTTTSDNGGTIIVDASNRRWYRETGGRQTSGRWFGVVGDGTTDDAPAIRAAINSLPTTGGKVSLPTSGCLINSTIVLGDGSGSTPSTRWGIELVGEGIPGLPGIILGLGETASTRLIWGGGAAPMVQIAGPLQGWGLKNLWLDGGGVATFGVYVIGASTGDNANITIVNCASSAIYGISSGPYGAIHNYWRNTNILVATIAGAKGITLTGVPADNANSCYWEFYNTILYMPATLATFGIYLQWTDSDLFVGTHFIGGNSSTVYVEFDYTVQANLPSSNGFVSIDAGGLSSAIQYNISGSPNSGARPNWIKGIGEINLGTQQNLPNLDTDLPQQVAYAAPANQTGAISPTTALFTPYVAAVYRISINMVITVAGSAGSIYPEVLYNDGIAPKTLSAVPSNVTVVGGATQADFVIVAVGGSPVEYGTVFTGVTGPVAYNLFITAERIG